MAGAPEPAFGPGYAGPGTYLHMKGGRYRVHGLGRHEATSERFVVYASERESSPEAMWLRPREDFDAIVDGRPRFQRIA